jgi:hypothetical protein
MVVVKIEIWPHGDESKAREIGRAKIANDNSGTSALGNYEIELSHSGAYAGRPGVWKRGRLSGFFRRSSPYHLVMLALGAVLLDR